MQTSATNIRETLQTDAFVVRFIEDSFIKRKRKLTRTLLEPISLADLSAFALSRERLRFYIKK